MAQLILFHNRVIVIILVILCSCDIGLAMTPRRYMAGVVGVALGNSHSILLKEDGSVWGTGQNSNGQLGDGTREDKTAYMQVVSSGGKVIAAGGYHSLVLMQDGAVWTAGWNKYGQLGYESISDSTITCKFVQVMSSGAKALAAGDVHSIVLKEDGSVWTTGQNSYGQLGDRMTLRSSKRHFEQVVISGEAKAIAAGSYHSVVLTQTGGIWATGWNVHGQLGDASTTKSRNKFVQVMSKGAKAVAAGDFHTIVLKQDGSVWTTGQNKHGQLGDGSRTKSMNFVLAMSGSANAVAAGGHHSLVLKQGGSVWATGWNKDGQLGYGPRTDGATIDHVQLGSNSSGAAVAVGSGQATGKNNHGYRDGRTNFVQVFARGAKAVAAGRYHSMLLTQDGSVWATGSNANGQLGHGVTTSKKSFFNFVQIAIASSTSTTEPIHITSGLVSRAVASITGVAALALGNMHSMVLKQDGSMLSSGYNVDGQLGIDSRFTNYRFSQAISSGAKAAAGGTSHSIVLKEDGSVWTTGQNSYGQLGDGFWSRSSRSAFDFVQVISGEAKAVDAGSYHSMVLTKDGGVWATGWNKYGQLGDASIPECTFRSKFLQVISSGAKAVAAGNVHSMVLKEDGSVWATGRNKNGQLGDESTDDRKIFVQVMSSGAKALAAGGYHSLVLKQDGTVWATGWNRYGQLGDRSKTDRTFYLQVFYQFTGAIAIAAGSRHSMIMKQDGSVWTTGRNYYGQLGDGSKGDRGVFEQVFVGGAKAIAAGGYHSMVLTQDGSVWATGSNKNGQLGYGSASSDKIFFKFIKIDNGLSIAAGSTFAPGHTTRGAFTNVVGLALGASHSLLLKEDGSVWATGVNKDGQLGDGTRRTSNALVKAIATGAQAVAAGSSHSIILKQDGSVWSTGQNNYGQLGDGLSSRNSRSTFVQAIYDGVKTISAGGYHSILVSKDGGVWVAGWNKYGQLGDASVSDSTSRSKFVKVISRGAKAVDAGDLHSIVVKQDGSVWATGRNNDGQLGDGSRTDRNIFVPVMSSGAEAVSAGGYHSLVLKEDGSVWATGRNLYGQLGDASLADKINNFFRVIPSAVKAVSAGARHSIVLKKDDSVWAAGSNSYGQLGDGSKFDKRTFVQVMSSGAKAIAAGGYHSMVLKQDGSVHATGSNRYGQLGHSFTTRTILPSFVQVGSGAIVPGLRSCNFPFLTHVHTIIYDGIRMDPASRQNY